MEALAFGVPLVLLPVCNDQFVQAHFLRRAGCGLAFEQGLPPAEELRAALRAALDPAGELRRRLAPVTAAYRAHDGARTAAELITG
jgi:UDP:flavonoid glycosyltransferase YjiC (YdhE family)